MTALVVGIVIGAATAAAIGGPLATRWSARAEARWDRDGDAALEARPGLRSQVERLAADEALFAAYQRQYWTWAGMVGGATLGAAVAGFLGAWGLDRSGRPGPAAMVAVATAVIVAGATMFWVRKLIAKRRISRLIYRKLSS